MAHHVPLKPLIILLYTNVCTHTQGPTLITHTHVHTPYVDTVEAEPLAGIHVIDLPPIPCSQSTTAQRPSHTETHKHDTRTHSADERSSNYQTVVSVLCCY